MKEPQMASTPNGMPHRVGGPHNNAPRLPPRAPPKPENLQGRGGQASQQVQQAGETLPFGKDDIVIAVMGVTGAGKSTFISLLSGDQIKIGHGLQSCTAEVGVHCFLYKGVRIFLVDTPGFDDTNRSDSEVLKDVAFWLAAAYNKDTRLAGIIYLHRISDPKMLGSTMRNLRMFRQLCGENNLNSVVLATTHWSNADGTAKVSEAEGGSRTDELVSTDDFWGSMVQHGSVVVKHDGSKKSALEIVGDIVDRRVSVILDIQRQLIDEKLDLDDTDAGQALQSELIAERKKFEQKLAETKEDMDEAIRSQNLEWQQKLEADKAKFEAEVNKRDADLKGVQTNMQKIVEEKDAQFRAMQEEMDRRQREHEEKLRESAQAIKDAEEARRQSQLEYERHRQEAEARAERERLQYQEDMRQLQAAESEERERREEQYQQQVAQWEAQQEENRRERKRQKAAEEALQQRLDKEKKEWQAKQAELELQTRKRHVLNPKRLFLGEKYRDY